MAESAGNVLHLGKTPLETILKLSWPTILEQVAFTALQFADTAMVGVLGAACTAAVGISTPITWLVNGIIAASGVGFSVQVAQNIGAGEYPRAQRVVQHAFSTAALLGGATALCCFLLSPALPHLMGAQPEVAPLAQQYLAVLSLSIFFNSFEVAVSSVLRCMGNTRTPMIANVVSIFLNLVVNFLLIFPARTVTLGGRSYFIWGAGMGVAGAAWGTTVSVAVAALLVFLALTSHQNPLRLELDRGLLRPDRTILSQAVRLGVPVALERVVTSLGQVLFMRIVATLGTVAVAAHHLAVQAESLSYMPAFGFSVAATTLVGQAVGARLPEDAKKFGHTAARVGLLCMTVTGLVLFLFSNQLISLFSRDPEVIALGGLILKIEAFAQPMQAWSIIYAGALRGAGDSRWPFYISLAGVWGIRLGLSVLFTFGFHWGLAGAWLTMVVDLCFRGVACWRRFSRSAMSP